MVRKLHEDLRITITYHSNSIEGNSLDLTETRIAIEDGLTVGGHPIKDYLETTNHAKAFDLMTELAQGHQPISLEVVKEIHRLVMAGIHEQAGEFRTRQVYITGAPHTPPPAHEVLEYMQGSIKALEPGAALSYLFLLHVCKRREVYQPLRRPDQYKKWLIQCRLRPHP
jgi:Fic family protein